VSLFGVFLLSSLWEQKFVVKLGEWRESPTQMVKDLFQVRPDPWQEEALETYPKVPRLVLKACKGPGKTCVLSWIAWNFLLTRMNPKMAVTSVSGDQLRDVFWAEMTKWQSRSELLTGMFDSTTERIFNKASPKNWWLSARTWPKTGTAEDQTQTLAGLHDDYIMFILDESGSIPDAVMVTAEAAFAGSPIEAHIIQAGNPTTLSGPLYRACTTSRHLWHLVEITADPDNPKRTSRVSVEFAREQIAQWGRYHPYVLVNIFGEFPPSSMNALIGPDEVRAAFKRYYRPYEIGQTPKIMGVDISRYGNDESAIAFREGIQAYPFQTYRNINGDQGAAIVNREWQRWNADACFLDGTGGWGTSWEDGLQRLGRSPVSIQFNSQAHQKLQFANKRAEMYWDMCDWIRRGGALPQDDRFLREVTETTYSIPKDVIIIEPKEMLKARLGYSPDRADAMALTFAEPVSIAARVADRRRPVLADYKPFDAVGQERASSFDEFNPFGHS
jgi:phage terminase large subunit